MSAPSVMPAGAGSKYLPRRWYSLIASCFCELCSGTLYAVGLYMPYLQAHFHLTLSQVQVAHRVTCDMTQR
jgi:hypothetical protein